MDDNVPGILTWVLGIELGSSGLLGKCFLSGANPTPFKSLFMYVCKYVYLHVSMYVFIYSFLLLKFSCINLKAYFIICIYCFLVIKKYIKRCKIWSLFFRDLKYLINNVGEMIKHEKYPKMKGLSWKIQVSR